MCPEYTTAHRQRANLCSGMGWQVRFDMHVLYALDVLDVRRKLRWAVLSASGVLGMRKSSASRRPTVLQGLLLRSQYAMWSDKHLSVRYRLHTVHVLFIMSLAWRADELLQSCSREGDGCVRL